MVKSEHWHFYYTCQGCELEEFGLKFGFFESVLKTRYKGVFNCLNIKASISQKKFFLTTHQNFSNFFFNLKRLVEKVSHTSACKRYHLIQIEIQDLQFRPNGSKTAEFYELNRIFHPIWPIVRDVPNVYPIN